VIEGKLVKRASMPGSPEVLINFIKHHFKGAGVVTAYEAGFSGFALHRALIEEGIKNIVVHAASIEVAARERVKTDKRDSLKIAIQLDCGRLRGIRVPSVEEEARRVLHRTRDQLVKKRTSGMNQIRMRLYQFGVAVTEPRERISRKRVAECIAANPHLPSEVIRGIQSLVAIWEALSKEIRALDRELIIQASKDPLEKTYRSLPGIGAQASRVLSTELGDALHFSNERALFSFTGLTPSERSSGESQCRGNISRQGRSRLRAILVESAWIAVRKDAAFKKRFLELLPRLGKRRAIVAMARKLVGLARALFRKQQLYNPPVQLAA
jgi:transposase